MSPSRVPVRLLCALLGLATFALYLPTAWYGFVSLDDPYYLVDNPMISSGLTWEGVRYAFSLEFWVWHPLAFLAHMVTADGILDEREVEVAEREAISHLGGGFDAREFREFCRNSDQLAPLSKLTVWSTKFLTATGFEMLLDMLEKIAAADGELHEREKKILDSVRVIYEELKAAEAAGESALWWPCG